MPLYEYICRDCGPFTEIERMARASEPMPCPSCEQLAPRGISAPFLADMDPNNRIAHGRNEKSAHEPKVGNVKKHDHSHHGHGHGHGKHRHVHKGSRPWMIGH
ncbi:MAG: zinc ribbon domain-containing protein [Rhodospirillaceae bacterium]|nr:zinc ribbon domain-containing protein [Rhodospirillaceae bacterium]MDE0618006.1 zinc ribbon domain-containing protein [Rhodospirillaceae bacterium]